MKIVAMALALVLAGACKKKNEGGGEPATGSGSGSGSAAMTGSSGSGSGSDAMTDTAAMTGSGSIPAPAGCSLAVRILGDHVEWTAPDGAGTSAQLKPGWDGAELREAVKALAGRSCSAVMSGDPKASYQVLITAMDAVMAGGIKNISVEGGHASSDSAPSAGVSKDDLKTLPVVIVTKTAVTFGGKDIATLDDPDIVGKLGQPLAGFEGAKSQTLILQADQGTSYGVIAQVITAANSVGYQDVLFAVKN